MTLQEAISAFRIRCQAMGLSGNTLSIYRSNLNAFARFADKDPALCKPHDVTRFLWSLRQRGRKDSTVHMAYRGLRTFFKFLHREEIVPEDITARVDPPRKDTTPIEPFTSQEVAALLSATGRGVMGLRDRALMVLLADTGLRIQEVLDTRVRDVDMDRLEIPVVGKGRRQRVVPFGASVLEALTAWLEARRDQECEALFLSRSGGPLLKRDAQATITRYGKAAGITRVRCSPHTFRHYFAVQFIRNGGDPFRLQMMLGHSTLEMTRRYVLLAQQDVRDEHRRVSPMDGLLKPRRRRLF